MTGIYSFFRDYIQRLFIKPTRAFNDSSNLDAVVSETPTLTQDSSSEEQGCYFHGPSCECWRDGKSHCDNR